MLYNVAVAVAACHAHEAVYEYGRVVDALFVELFEQFGGKFLLLAIALVFYEYYIGTGELFVEFIDAFFYCVFLYGVGDKYLGVGIELVLFGREG